MRSEKNPVSSTQSRLEPEPTAKAVAAVVAEKPTSVAKGTQCTAMIMTVHPAVIELARRRRKGAVQTAFRQVRP